MVAIEYNNLMDNEWEKTIDGAFIKTVINSSLVINLKIHKDDFSQIVWLISGIVTPINKYVSYTNPQENNLKAVCTFSQIDEYINELINKYNNQ